MAAPRRTEDYQEADQSSKSEPAFTPGTSTHQTQEVKRHVAKKDSGVGKLLHCQVCSHSNWSGLAISGLFDGHEVSTTSGKLGTNQSKDPREGKPAVFLILYYMFEVQADLGYHLQNRESTAPHHPRFLLNQHILEVPQIIKRHPRTLFAILLRLKTTKFNPLQVCQLKIRTSGTNILLIRPTPTPSLEQYCQCRSNHRPPLLPLTKTAGKKTATTFVDFNFSSGFATSRTVVLQPSIVSLVKGVVW
jgi:hypothetical protein